ncbi:DNA phosphorothioation-dependent restriction protein [Phytophthora megakarya]|uniref:DNA phosphorothioation-dependent restriction protein n=1 Tax=Phytophthora megakarya TaxID=4795 RepID=A0A225W4A8_9STRA|nr:DNA phosphorothioation-dependent restriction protein [Phytophthora megakarya]
MRFFWIHLRFLLAFSAAQPFLRWRFTQDRGKVKTLNTLAKLLVPVTTKQVCIAYGDWSRRDGIKYHATGPVKGFLEGLKKRATVISVAEYRTSKMCSCCHQRLKQARRFTEVKRKTDKVDIRTRGRKILQYRKCFGFSIIIFSIEQVGFQYDKISPSY